MGGKRVREWITMNELLPVFLKLDNLHTLVVGGGPVGVEKLAAILGNSPVAKATVVAEHVTPAIRELVNQSARARLLQRRFEYSDLNGIDILFLATGDRPLNEAIYAEARKRKILVNTADTPDLCNFYMSSIVRKGDLKIAISTNGKSPTMAKRLREFLTEIIPEEIQETLIRLNAIRNGVKGDFQTKVKVLNEITSGWMNKKGLDNGSASAK